MSDINYHIWIPTRGRTEEQMTVQRLPKYIHKHITLVCPKEEVKALKVNFPTVNVMAQPEDITTLPAKREWIFKQSEHKYNLMMDDDLYFYVFADGKHMVRDKDKAASKKFFTETLPQLCRDYKCVGFGTKAFAQKGGVKENYHLGFVFGWHRSVNKKIVFNRIASYVDIDYTLQLLKAGVRIAITYDMVVTQKKAGAAGGLSGERTDEVSAKALRKLIKLHPDVVKEKEASGQHSQSNTRISWRGAAKIGGLV